ncbi:hypothetical protein B0H34DRAFT_838433 [Crassisporium funariophilum]|nr:hypothetical protein B0H34DRAFT_838433 [Crassisporium funariophilum]
MANVGRVPSGIICTEEQFSRSIRDTSIYCLTRGESIGLTVVSQAGIISLIAVLYVSLFFADVLQAIGAVMDIKWVQDGKVEVGGFCDAQGIVQQLGETGAAMTTLTIAVFTFLGVWLGKGVRSIWLTRAVIGSVWLFIILVVVIGNVIHNGSGSTRYQSPTPLWCWISEDYLHWRIWGEYVWFWITLAFSIVMYTPLYLWSRGNILIDERAWWKFTLQHADKSDPALKGIRRRSLVMLAYPIVYCLTILPLSVVRWIGFVQERNGGISHISSTATLAVAAIYGLSGAFNVLLLLTTRPDSVLFGKPTNFSLGRAPSPLTVSPTTRNDYAAKNMNRSDEEGTELGRLPSRSSGGWP